MLEARLSTGPFSPSGELEAFERAVRGQGAVVSFTGLARALTIDEAPVERLFLDHHPRLTQHSLTRIGQAALARFDAAAALIVHRFGGVEPGEPIVFAAAAARHRRSAFEAVDYMMDRLKTDAIFWKREDGPSGSRWIEPRDDDRAARARWGD